MLSGQAQAFFQETVAPVLHVDTTGSKLRNLFVPVLADSEVDTTGNRWDKVAVSTGMDTETAFSCETGNDDRSGDSRFRWRCGDCRNYGATAFHPSGYYIFDGTVK